MKEKSLLKYMQMNWILTKSKIYKILDYWYNNLSSRYNDPSPKGRALLYNEALADIATPLPY